MLRRHGVRERDPDPVIDYVMFWIEHAGPAIRLRPRNGVHHWTHRNYSGGYTGWEDPVNQVYFKPRTLEERLLRGQVYQIMLDALEWALRNAEAETPHAPWTVWKGMDLAEAYRLCHMVAEVDPTYASAFKVRLNKICLRMGKTLEELAGTNFSMFVGPHTGIRW